MKLHELKPNKGARKDKHVKGRGHAAGKGKQAGKGQSGQNKRGGTRPGFEGGQNPWFRRLPKRGFTNVNHVEYQTVDITRINDKYKDGEVVSFETLKAKNLISRKKPVKILGNSKLTVKVTFEVDAMSAAVAKQAGIKPKATPTKATSKPVATKAKTVTAKAKPKPVSKSTAAKPKAKPVAKSTTTKAKTKSTATKPKAKPTAKSTTTKAKAKPKATTAKVKATSAKKPKAKSSKKS